MKKFIFGIIITTIGFLTSGFCFVYAVLNPCVYNGNTGLYYGFQCTYTLKPFIVSLVILILGLLICAYEAYSEEIRRVFKKL